MTYRPRFYVVFAIALTSLTLCLPLRASELAPDHPLPDASTLAQMEARAQQAKPKEQCFLYTELVHSMTEIAAQDMLNGEIEKASAMLQRVRHYAELIRTGMAKDSKKLMNAQMLMHHTTRRLSDFVRRSSYEDREPLQATLKQLTQVEDEMLNKVFTQ